MSSARALGLAVGAALSMASPSIDAQTIEPPMPGLKMSDRLSRLPSWREYVELGIERHAITNNFGEWKGFYLKGTRKAGDDVWNAEFVHTEAFGDRGSYGSIGWTHVLDRDWYTYTAAGGGSGRFFFPQKRFDAFVNYKWREPRGLVTTFGAGYLAAKDAHRDHSLFAGATYYFPEAWIVETGARWNRSNPGNVHSQSGFVAVTYGTEGRQYLIGRATFGREAYQLLTPNHTLVDFASQAYLVTWRRWLPDHWGLNMTMEYYRNVAYHRVGGRLGLFREF